MQKGRYRTLFVDTSLCCEIQHVDPAERAIWSAANQLLDGARRVGVGRLPQNRE
jgi:hypothetical protein